jgi:methyl-accepting chemotaxis protein
MGISVVALLLGGLLTWFIAHQIVVPLQAAVGIARDVADGNLSLREVRAASDETGQVLRALGEVTQRLNGMIGEIRNGAEQIDTAASEISNGNNDLASRTEQTASALQATSSSVAELANTIRLNAETSIRASQLAAESSHVAKQGGTDVAEVVATMDAISLQAKRIGEIIGTIDGIAFQTNILALNAAVEAARAGEQGRGFAVVASEVRSLAQRSSEAAKEIRVLIGASANQVASGTLKVHAAGETMRRIVASIEQVSTMVAEISRATAAQADAIHGVNQAVSDMDRSTQQNAALVEQSAAAAESLRLQAAGLVQTISVFHVAQSAQQGDGSYRMRRLN